jgi:exodeoxyribonuclease VII small subunit
MKTDHSNSQTLADITESLDDLIIRLENDGIPIEDALAAYEEGVRLLKLAQERLDAAQQRVLVLSESNTNDQGSTGERNTDPANSA